METDKTWETDDMFLLWDEDWALESAYSHEPTGYVACPADLIQGLRMQFPDVTYRTADFSDYDAYFTLRGYQNMEQALEEDPVDGDWVGCILVKDNKFYFGSYENQITGIPMSIRAITYTTRSLASSLSSHVRRCGTPSS